MLKRDLLQPTWKNLFYPPEEHEYSYFEDGLQHQFPPSTSQPATPDFYRRAGWAADASMLAYGRFGQKTIPAVRLAEILKSAGFEHHVLIGDWFQGTGGTQCLFSYNARFAMLAFRGTERDDPLDSITDALTLLVDEPDYSIAPNEYQKALRHLQFIEQLFEGERCLVHAGFQKALNQVWPDVHNWISSYRKQYSTNEICFTGHSLGAALATLAVSRFGGRNASLFTFGSPRAGNEAFCNRVRRAADLGVFRFGNGSDPVAHVPIHDVFYRHIEAGCYHISPNGVIDGPKEMPTPDWGILGDTIRQLPESGIFTDLNADAPADLVDHSPSRYCIQLWNHVL